MDLFEGLTLFSILIECAIFVLAVLIATRNRRAYGWLIAITFALFAFFNGIRLWYPSGLPRLNGVILLAACVSMLYAIWQIYEETRKKSK
ncbi:hypothetical protein Mboo_2162 [Methanoregula boonei 6A8]|jgi:hypothetical protein|uniref:Uncharacterized protein n=1 Tax=Methanoregula boonei (strain DSM 21154 / JCM 14090 / 6A8) TaxID=456442 RepID=A7IAB5_METB6|nr:hypothetical protein [Methanoregula boonei]ABS56676.1 hypothetical protein Mboo_2162 [Methanoregula boonei 6A8]